MRVGELAAFCLVMETLRGDLANWGYIDGVLARACGGLGGLEIGF